MKQLYSDKDLLKKYVPFYWFGVFLKINLFIYFWLHWVFVAARGPPLVAASRATPWCGARASHCGGWSRCRAWALDCRLSSCGERAQLLRGMWDLPGAGLKPMSPALAGGFLTTAPPGKSLIFVSDFKIHKRPQILPRTCFYAYFLNWVFFRALDAKKVKNPFSPWPS